MKETQEDNKDKQDINIIKSKTFEMNEYDSNSRQNSFSSVGTLHTESIDYNLDNQYSNGVFVIYFDYFMSIFLFANSFIYYSFINIFHLCYSFFLISAKYSTLFTFLVKNKGKFSLLLLVLDFIYIIFKMIIDIRNRAKGTNSLEEFFPNGWASIYEYIVVCLIMLFILIYLIAKDFSRSAFKKFDYERNKNFLFEKIQNNNNILNTGIFLICFGCTIYPTTINFIILLFGLLYFFCIQLGVTCRRFIKKHFRRTYMAAVFIYIIYNYIINTKLYEFDLGKVVIFDDANNTKYLGIFSFILFYIGFFCININIKVVQLIKYSMRANFNEDTEEFIINDINVTKYGKYKKSDEEKKLETLFATDIDCGIIDFSKKCENEKLPKKIKLFIFKFCYTPGFCLHVCRLSVILWINLYMTYVSLFLIIWLFFSIKYSESKAFLYGTKCIIYPLLIILFLSSYVANIFGDTLFPLYNEVKIFEYLGIKEKNESTVHKGIHLCLKIIIVIFFELFIRLKTMHYRNLRNPDITEEIIKQQKELEIKIEHDFNGKYVIKPFEIFFKLYFFGLDIVVIVFFYLAVTQTINILNEIVLLCIIALFLTGKKFMNYLYLHLCVLNFFFLLKYIIYFYDNTHKVKIKSNNIKLVLSLLFNDNLYHIHYYWIAFYLLFLEYIGQTSKLFKLCKTKKFSIYEIVQYNFDSYEIIKLIFEIIFNFIFGIYIWLLIPCFIYCLLIRDNNVFGLFQFLIVFIIYYKYIKIVGIQFNNLSNIFTYTNILIITNVFNIIMLYAIQFLNKAPMSIWYNLSSEKRYVYLELIGLFLFDENYQKHLFPYFTMFVLSIALNHEIRRQIALNTKDEKLKNEIRKLSLRYKEDDNNNEIKEKDNKKELLLKDYLKSDDINKDEKYIDNSSVKSPIIKKDKNEKKMIELKQTKIVEKIYYILYYILHYYWIIIFIFIAALSLHWMLSVSMAIQLTIFCYYMAKSFNGYYKFLRMQNNETKNLNKKLQQYRAEKIAHFDITYQTQRSYFNLIWIFTFLFIVSSYLCCIIIKYYAVSNNITNLFYCPRIEEIQGQEGFSNQNLLLNKFIAIMYFFGFFSAPQEKNNSRNFWSYTKGYFLTILLFSIRAYFLSKFAEINVKYFNSEDNNKDKKSKESKKARKSGLLKNLEIEKIKKFSNQIEKRNNSTSDYDNYENILDDAFKNNKAFNDGILLNFVEFEENHKNEINNNNIEKNKNNIFIIRENIIKELYRKFIDKYFRKEKTEFTIEKSKYHYYKDDFDINYKKTIYNKNIEFNISVQKILKKLIELLILFLIFLNVLLKCNILSFIFLIIIIITYHQKNINIQLFFRVSYFILLLLIVQYTVFVSNLSYLTNTYINSEIISCINNYLGIPWINNLNYNNRWATFLSLGTNIYQVKTLWLDVSIVLLLYFYLEFFSFTLYKDDNNDDELKFIYYKYNQKFEKLKTISKSEYQSFLRAMKVSYDIELQPSLKNRVIINNEGKQINLNKVKKFNKQMLNIAYKFKKDKKYLFLNKTAKIRGYDKITSIFYISFHYILLTLTLMISLINQGLIALGYICFSIFYLYKSHCFLKGRRWTLLYGINYVIKPYLFLDIIIQFIFQIPFDIYIKNNEKLKDLNNVLGLVKISDYSSTSSLMIKEAFIMVLLKILTYILFLIQENIYLSYEFKKFILKYHYKYLQKAYIKGKLHSFLFNNYRVKLMNDRLSERKDIKHNLFNIQNIVNNWNTNITSYSSNNINNNNNTNNENNLYEIPLGNELTTKKRDKELTIKAIIRKHWLVSLTLKIFESARSVDDEHFNIGGEVMKILQGNTVLFSYLLNLIEDFEKKNFYKYSNIQKFIEREKEKEKKREKEKEKEKNKKKNNIIEEEEISFDNQTRKKTVMYKKISYDKKFILNDNDIDKIIEEEENDNSRRTLSKSIKLKKDIINEQSKEIEYLPNEKRDNNNGPLKKGNIIDKYLNDNNNNQRYIKLDQPYDDMFFANWDYKQMKSAIREDFFNTYCSRKKIFIILIKDIFKFFGENFEYITYTFMLLNHLFNGSVTSIFYPIAIFLFGICQYPRPSRLFWKILLVYTTFLIFLKFILQLNIWKKIDIFLEILEDIKSDNLIFNLGLKKVESNNFIDFLIYIFPDFLVLMVLIMHQFILIRKGLWYSCETDYETIEESNDRIIKFNSNKKIKEIGINIDNKRVLPSNEIVSLIGKLKQPKKENIIKRISNFYNINFTRLRNEKPGKDFYMSYTIFLIFILIYIIFFYTKMEQDKMVYNVDTFKLKQFSVNTVIFAFIHVFLLVFDRFLYLKNARKLQKISYKVYNKINGEDITIRYKDIEYEDIVNIIYKDKYNKKEVIAYQYEDCQIGLLLKYITQIIMVLFIHIFIYFYLPKTTYSNQQALNQAINRISENYYTLVFYILYLFYFLFSGLQIKHGMTDIKKVSSLMKASNTFYSLIYKCYIQIPFLFELKNFIDWTFTKTSLNLWKWLKLEEIISLLFINKCYSKAEMMHRVGEKIPIYMKFFMGSTTFFIVIIIIFGPLILFSYLNPLSLENKVTGVNFKLILSIPTNYSQKLNLTLFETTNSYIEDFDSEEEYNSFFNEMNNSKIKDYKKSFKYTQVQYVTVIHYTESNWAISSKFINYLENLNESEGFDINLKYSFQRKHDSSSQHYGIESQKVDPQNILKISEFFRNNNTNNISFEVDNCYSMYQRIPNDEKPMALISNNRNKIKLTLKREEINVYNWYIETENNEGIKFITFSDLYSQVTFGYDVLTFYVTFVILAGQVIRGIFLGSAERIMFYQMVNPNRLLSLCEGIKISRIRNDFLQEEKLYYLLIDLMRSPEIIKNMTQSSLIFIQDSNTVKKNEDNNELDVTCEAIIRKSSKQINTNK